MRRVRAIFPILTGLVLFVPSPALGSAQRVSATVWAERYDAGGLLDRAYAVAVSPNGARVFVTGESSAELGNNDFATVAYDTSTGSQLWVSRYDGPGTDSYDVAYEITADPEGSRVYVTGQGTPGFTTVAYDAATGSQLWVSRYAGGTATHVAVTPDGAKVIVAGGDGWSWHTIAYDAATGAQLWIVQFVQGYPVNLHAMALSPDGSRVYDTGDFYTGSQQDYATVAYDTGTGHPLWTAFYDDPEHGDDHTRAIGVSPDGSRVFITGMARPKSRTMYNTIAYDAATGTQLWVSTYDNQGVGGHVANALDVSVDGTLVFVAGSSWGRNSSDYATVAYDTVTGTQEWVARYNGPVNGPDAAADLEVDPQGGLVYVTGRSSGDGTQYDYATVAYDVASGDQVWELRYDNPGHGDDQAKALAVGTGGSVFVTGGSLGAGTKSDYATQGRLP